MKKIVILVLVCLLAMMVTSCKNVGEPSVDLEEFDKSATVEKSILYDENNIKITVNGLSFNDYAAELSVTMENNTDTAISFISGTGLNSNAVNGYMLQDVYLRSDIPAGESTTDNISFYYKSLNVLGITDIADMNIAFNVVDDKNKDFCVMEPVKVKTSHATVYDYSVNRYRNIMKNGVMEKTFECKINHFAEDIIYDNNGIKISSEAAITNKDGENALLLEIENNSDDKLIFTIRDVYVNDVSVYKTLWASGLMQANTKQIKHISFDDLLKDYIKESKEDIEISKLSFEYSVRNDKNVEIDTTNININLPNIKVNLKNK